MRTILSSVLLFACTGENVIEKQENAAPTITILSHSDGTETLKATSIFRAQVSDDDNQFEELKKAWFVGDEEVCPWTMASNAGESFTDIVYPKCHLGHSEVRDTQGADGR